MKMKSDTMKRKLAIFLFGFTLWMLVLQSVSLGNEPLRKKIGQMIIVGFTGISMTDTAPSIDTLRADIIERNLGGVILFRANVKNPGQVSSLTSQLNSLSAVPLFIATDQEGGMVARLSSTNGYAKTNTAYRLGTVLDREDSTRFTASLMAGWLRDAGINFNFAPVVDVNVNPLSPAIGAKERSYSSNPLKVAEHAYYFIDEMHKKSIMTALKHFPGHGSAMTDTHLGFTEVTATWADSELVPYNRLIADNQLDIIMTAHIFNRNIDTVYPATLSYNTVTGILRNQMGYEGVVISDDMMMGAITRNFQFEDAVVNAINAGVDILLYASNLNNGSVVRRIIDIVEKKVRQGIIPESRIDEAYNRIMDLKAKYLNVTGIEMLRDVSLAGQYKISGYPNPFNAATKIRYNIPVAGEVSIRIYDMIGREAAVLVEEFKEPGTYSVTWNANNYSSGVYFARLISNKAVRTSKIILLK